MAGRPRRTRIYGANYNIGESYYKPTLDNLNRKQFGSSNEDSGGLRFESKIRDLDNELMQPKTIFKKALTEEPTFFDFRGRPTSLNSASLLDEDLDEDVQTTLRKIREVKKVNSSFLDDNSSSFDTNFGKRSLDVGRALKSFYDTEDNDTAGVNITRLKRTSAIDETSQSNSSASLRANATKERLANIESDMSERFEKQIQREKRSANLKKLLSETDIESSKSVKKVTF